MRAAGLFIGAVLISCPAWAAPSVEQLIRAQIEANAGCRGGDPDSFERQDECARRDRLYGRLTQAGWCYGKRGQVGADFSWHRCGPGSIMPNDLAASKMP